jgi:hypothetical protein
MKLENAGRYKGVKKAQDGRGRYHWVMKLRGLHYIIKEYRSKVARLQNQIKWACSVASPKKPWNTFNKETGKFKRHLPPSAHLAKWKEDLFNNEWQLAAQEKECRLVEAQFKQWIDGESLRETEALLHCDTPTLKRRVRADARKAGIEKPKV